MMHLNLHKTFSTPHGGGGPGAGPVGVRADLARYLPGLRSRGPRGPGARSRPARGARPKSVGDVHGHHGNFGMLLRAYAYILRYGGDGLRRHQRRRRPQRQLPAGAPAAASLEMPHAGLCMHEFVASGSGLRKYGVRTTDVAKRLLDFGVHAPTIYFPLIVPEALMIEPTETESKETLDAFVGFIERIVAEAAREPAPAHGGAPRDARGPAGRSARGQAARGGPAPGSSGRRGGACPRPGPRSGA